MFNVQSTYFILALFVRDDGERFLLGDGMYEFADKQLHFAPNSVQSDIVELQGSDGQLLAGQVMRSSKQTFEGIIGDQTSTRTEIENARRRFFNFFKTNKKYQVIYVLPDGRSITRYKGFIVEAPSAQELYQLTPKFSVALMFEELPYYAYAEDDEGNPDFTNRFALERSTLTQVLSGGLEWDSTGAVWVGAPAVFVSKNKCNTSIYSTKSSTAVPVQIISGAKGEYNFQMELADGTASGSPSTVNAFIAYELNPNSNYTISVQCEGFPEETLSSLSITLTPFLNGTAGSNLANIFHVEAMTTQTQAFSGNIGNNDSVRATFSFALRNEPQSAYSGTIRFQIEEGQTMTAWEKCKIPANRLFNQFNVSSSQTAIPEMKLTGINGEYEMTATKDSPYLDTTLTATLTQSLFTPSQIVAFALSAFNTEITPNAELRLLLRRRQTSGSTTLDFGSELLLTDTQTLIHSASVSSSYANLLLRASLLIPAGTLTATAKFKLQFEYGTMMTQWVSPIPYVPPTEDEGAVWEEATIVEGENHINKLNIYTMDGEPIKPHLRLSAGTYSNITLKNLANNTVVHMNGSFTHTSQADLDLRWWDFILEQGLNEIILTATTLDGTAQLVWNEGVVG